MCLLAKYGVVRKEGGGDFRLGKVTSDKTEADNKASYTRLGLRVEGLGCRRTRASREDYATRKDFVTGKKFCLGLTLCGSC